ncbi:MAG TPA: asparagine synthase-related protein, partial [Gemmatimonadaceae bacterium]|nr:asparagine synthase-related protein [Gemmatimonadaceae bacterium]
GLDSSSIVCMARRLQRSAQDTPLHAFSLVFPSLPQQDRVLIDERRHIDSVGRSAEVQAVAVRGDLLSPVAGVDELLAALDEPYLAPNLYLHQAMYRSARDAGVRVFLDGFDGDTTVSHGFGRLCALVQEGRWSEFEAELRATAGNRAVSPATLLAYFGRPYLRTLARRGDWRGWLGAARELRRRFRLSFRELLVRDGFAASAPRVVDGVRRHLARRDARARSLLRAPLLRDLRRHSAAAEDPDIEATLSERAAHAAALDRPAYQLTLEMADKCAASFGVEARYPFFDRRLIEFCLALPDEQKLDGGWTRLVLRRAMAGILPPDVQWRPDKGNLSPNFHRALRSSAAIRFDRESLAALEPYVDIDALRDLADGYARAERTLARAEDGHTLFRAVVLSRWLARRDSNAPAGPRAPPSSVAA